MRSDHAPRPGMPPPSPEPQSSLASRRPAGRSSCGTGCGAPMRPVILRRPDSADVFYLARVTTELGDASGAVRTAQIDIQVVVRPLDVQEASGWSISVAWSHDEPHDQSDQDEEQHAHSKPTERTHSVAKATHHGELLLHLPGSRTPPVSRPNAVFAARRLTTSSFARNGELCGHLRPW